MAAFMSKEGMPKKKFRAWLALEQFNLRLLYPEFPDFHFIYCIDTFQRILYDITKKLVYQDWITTRLFHLTFDTYTSTNKRTQLAACVRFLSPIDWSPREILLSVIQLGATGENAEVILDDLAQMLVAHGIPLDWLVGVTADGSKVNHGKLAGVIKRLAQKIEHLHSQICAAHSFALFSLSFLFFFFFFFSFLSFFISFLLFFFFFFFFFFLFFS
jgi:hypothetical protein